MAEPVPPEVSEFEAQDRSYRDQYAALGKEIARLQGIDVRGADNRVNARNIAMSILGSNDRIKATEFLVGPGSVSDSPFYQDPDTASRSVRRFLTEGYSGYQDILAQKLSSRVKGLTEQQQALAGAARERRIGQLTAREAALKQELEGTTGALQSEIDQMLSRELVDLGIGAGEARRSAGASLAARGLTDSTVASRYGADIALGEVEQKGKIRGAALEQQKTVEKGKTDVLNQIKWRREQIQQASDFASMEQAADLSFAIDTEQFKLDTERMLVDMQLDADSKAFTSQLLGGIAGGAAQLFLLA